MKLKRTTQRNIRWEDQDLDEIEKHVYDDRLNPDGEFENFSKAVRQLTLMGCKLLDFQKMMKDPAKAKEFQKKMREVIENEKVFEWTATLSESQLSAFSMALKMEKDSRYENKKLL